MKTELNNVVIECLSKEHGQEIKAIFIKNGVDVGNYLFTNTKESDELYRYYGVLNGKFSNYSIEQVKAAGARIVELPEEESNLVPDFRVGDTVYYLHQIIGLLTLSIISISEYADYSITTEDSDGKKYTFTKNGQYTIKGTLVLSHTPYDLINGGFSQRMRKVLPDIPVDTLVYVKDSFNEWEMRYFAEWDNGKMKCWICQFKSHETNRSRHWNEWSLTNPLDQNN